MSSYDFDDQFLITILSRDVLMYTTIIHIRPGEFAQTSTRRSFLHKWANVRFRDETTTTRDVEDKRARRARKKNCDTIVRDVMCLVIVLHIEADLIVSL